MAMAATQNSFEGTIVLVLWGSKQPLTKIEFNPLERSSGLSQSPLRVYFVTTRFTLLLILSPKSSYHIDPNFALDF